MAFNESNFLCFSSFGCGCISRPINEPMLAPFVEMDFQGREENVNGRIVRPQGGSFIRVGNRSSTNNTAVIKSFQYGQSDGVGAEVEIYDEEGGEFKKFVERVAKTPEDSLTVYKTRVTWGYITSNCNGGFSRISSREHYFAIMTVDINFSGKGVIFKLELLDLIEASFETRINKTYDEYEIKQAIIQLFKDSTPRIDDVRFLRFKNQGALATTCANFNQQSSVGSVNFNNSSDFEELQLIQYTKNKTFKLTANQQSPLAVAREWISNYRSARDDKGIVVFYDNTKKTPSVIFLEDPKPKCFNDFNSLCNRSIGTYIVNGGKHSPVISFDPKIKFNFSAAARAGVAVGSQSSNAKVQTGQPCPPNQGGSSSPGSGSAGMNQIPEDANKAYGNKQAADEVNNSQRANEKANQTFQNIEAELKIQGNPILDDPFGIKIRTVSIIVLNPFHLVKNQGSTGCPEWGFFLARSPCNSILSNKNWFISGVFHDISEGSYTTTLKLYLPAPGTN